jgi:hypothetical protein
LRRAVILSAIVFVSLVGLTSCGGSAPANDPSVPPTTKLTKRVLLLNQFNGKANIVDAATDSATSFTVPADPLGFFVVAESLVKAGSKTLVIDSGSNLLHEIDNAKEDRIAAVGLSGFTESVVVTSDGAKAYAAIPSLGRIDVIDLAAGKLLDPINGIAGVRRLALTKNNGKLLAFSNDLDTITVVNTSDGAKSSPIPNFDRPYTAVFSADDSKAFVLNCGAECGGAQARVTVLDITKAVASLSASDIGASVNVGGATAALLDGNNLYVAGTPGPVSDATTNRGTFNIVNVSNTAALTASANLAISDGLHHTIAAVSGGKLYIGARRCTLITTQTVSKGCLSIVSPTGLTAVVGPNRGEVTSIEPIKNRTVVYVTEGGELNIYDTGSDTLQAKQLNVLGKAVDAKEID